MQVIQTITYDMTMYPEVDVELENLPCQRFSGNNKLWIEQEFFSNRKLKTFQRSLEIFYSH